MPANMENSAVTTGLEKVSFHSNPKERQCQRMFKLHTSYVLAIALISHASKVMSLLFNMLSSEVKWALGSIATNKASGGDGIPVELFQILKDDAVKVLYSICQQIWKTPATGQEKVSFHSNPKERQCQRMLKLLHNCTHFTHC